MARGSAITVASAAFLAVGGFLFGYDSGIIGSTIALDQFKEYFDNPDGNTDGGIVSSFQGGAVLGTIVNMVSYPNLIRIVDIWTDYRRFLHTKSAGRRPSSPVPSFLSSAPPSKQPPSTCPC